MEVRQHVGADVSSVEQRLDPFLRPGHRPAVEGRHQGLICFNRCSDEKKKDCNIHFGWSWQLY